MQTRTTLFLLLAGCASPLAGDTGKPAVGHDTADTGARRDTSDTGDSGPSETGDTGPGETGETGRDDSVAADADGDGFAEGDDCDDADADVHPGAPEDCDGVDDDCDGEIDEALGSTWYTDADGDGEGDAASALVDCAPPAGTVANADDCDDTDAAVNTGADEICGNTIDDDCDGDVDETCIPTGPLDTSLAQTTYESGIPGDSFGSRITPVADWTGDGVDEVAIGAMSDDTVDTSSGAVYVFDGADTGALTAADALAISYGGDYLFAYGETLTRAHDLDGDGAEDVLVGQTGWTWSPGLLAGAGDVAVVTGISGGALVEAVHWRFYEEYVSGGQGADTADLDGDGAAELVASAPLQGYSVGTLTGRVYVVPSADVMTGGDIADYGAALDGPADSYAGYSLATAGDLDGDGDDEVIVGSIGLASDVAWVLDGLATGGDLADWAVTTFTGDTGDFAGFETSAPGDLDGDGVVDLVITAPYDDTSFTDAGAAFVFDGATTGTVALSDARLVLTGETNGGWAGSSVSNAGDLDEDGRDDLFVGAKWHSVYDGRAYVVTGAPTGTVDLGASTITFDPTVYQQLGFEVEASTDFDGDGHLELFLSELSLRYGPSVVFRWSPAGG